MFRHLHIHSYFSMMWGTAPIEVLAKQLIAYGQDTFPLSDRNGLYGMIEHLKVCAETGLRPIVGCEIVTAREQALCLVKTRTGYHNLCEMLTRLYHDPQWNMAGDLMELHEGLVIITQTEALLKAGYPDADLYIDLWPGHVQRGRELAEKYRGIPLVATSHAYMISPKARRLHLLLRAIDTNSKLSRLPAGQAVDAGCYLAPPEEMNAFFAACPEAIEATRDIIEACRYAPQPGKLIFPPSEYDHAYKVLRDKTFAGLARRYGGITDAARIRADRELDMIRRKRFSNCFLVIEDVVSRFSLTCGRGSAAASIVSFALGITHVDPLEHNLFFERFLNPGRLDPPDIDVDFAWDERDLVRDYLWEKYGGSHIAMVCNHNRLRRRSAVRELAKVYGLGEKEMAHAASLMSRSRRVGKTADLPRPWPEILHIAERLEGYPRHISVHCGGVVITPDEITRHCPLRPMPIGYDVVPWDKDGVEDYGFVKLDFLGNRSLAVIRDCLSAVRENYNVDIRYDSFNPIRDPQAAKLIEQGNTMGCFYVESPATRLLLQKVGMGDFETLVAVSSIIRPAANKIANEWVVRHRRAASGKRPNWQIIHPKMEEVLAESHGLMIYQEDVTKTAMAVADFDAIDGDVLRKIVSKKHKEKLLRDYHRKFVEGCRKNGLNDDQIHMIWEMIMSFDGYSFCKPHSASYAMVSFKSAWLKYHYPAEFMAAVISNRGGFYSPFAYLSHARRLGCQVMGPDINQSRREWRGYNGVIYIGFGQIKGLKQATIDKILQERDREPYADLSDFMHRVRPGQEESRKLILAGCFDQLEPRSNRPGLIWRALYWHALHREQAEDLFPGYIKEEDLPKMQPYNLKTRLYLEKEIFGFQISRHPLERYDLSSIRRIRTPDIPRHIDRKVCLVGWLITHKTVTTAKGEPMAFLTFEDEQGLCETVMFPDLYRKRAMQIDYSRPFIIMGRVVSELGAITITLDEILRLEVKKRPKAIMPQILPAKALTQTM